MILKKIMIIFKHIPGYRSGNKINEVFATIYYLIPIIILLLTMIFGVFEVKYLRIIVGMLIFPFIVFSMLDNLNEN